MLTYHPLLETFVGLGLGECAIGRALGRTEGSQHYVLPPPARMAAAIERIPVVSQNFFPPPREQLLALRPDFLLAYGEHDYGDTNEGLATLQELEDAGVQAYAVVRPGTKGVGKYDQESLSDTYRTILDLGQIFGVSGLAQRRVARMQRQIDVVRRRLSGRPPVKVLACYPGRGEIEVAGGGIVSELLAAAGGENVFAAAPCFLDRSTAQVAANPVDAFVIFADATAARTGTLDGTIHAEFLFDTFPSMPASEQRRAVVTADQYLSPGGWRNASGVELLARRLHPTAFTRPATRDGRAGNPRL